MEVRPPDKPLPVDFWPHPLTTDGRCVIVAEPGKTLREVLEPHISLDQPAVATINGDLVVKERWGDVVLHEGDVVQARVTVAEPPGGGGSNPIAVVLSLAVLVAAPYLAGYALTGQFGGFGLIAAAETALGQVITAAIGIGGILIVNSLFPPRLPDTGSEEPTPQYSISGGANRVRPYGELQLLLGQHRLFPDFAAREYTEFDENNDQFLNQIFEFGLGGNLDISNIRIGETLLLASPPAPEQVPPTETAPSGISPPTVPREVSLTRNDAGMAGFQIVARWKAPASWGNSSNFRYGRRFNGSEEADTTATSWALPLNEEGLVEIRAESDDGVSPWVKASFGPTPSSGAPDPTTAQPPPPLLVDSPNFKGVQVQFGVTDVDLVSGNADTIAGGDFETQLADGEANGTPYITRTTAGDTTAIAFDLVSQHFRSRADGELEGRTAYFEVGWKLTTTSTWKTRHIDQVTPDGAEARNAVRRSIKIEGLAAGAYDVRVRLRTVYDDTDNLDRISYRASCPQMRAYQDSAADFTGRNPLALRIKASGQLYGRVETINADGAQLIPAWNGTAYVDDQRTSNPADILLYWLRGYRIGGRLVAGYGLTDQEIDFESLQEWHAFCEAEGLECNIVIQDSRDEDAVAHLICQCGWGRLDISSGKYGVLWENDNQPVTAVVTPANIVANTLSAGYDNENLADEIVGTFIDRDSDFKENELRRPVPNPTITGEFPVNIPLEGITSGTHAAKEINRTAAAQFYHQRIIGWEMTEEGFLGIGVGDVVGMANGLVGNGTGGRLMRIDAARTTVETSFAVEEPSGFCWVWLLDGSVLNATYTRRADGQITLSQALPAAPMDIEDSPHSYRITVFDAADTPYTKVRITGISAAGPGRFRFQARDEVPEFYAARTADLSHDLIPIELPYRPCPEGFEVTETATGVREASWVEPTTRAAIGYQLRYGPPGTDWDDMRDAHAGLLPGSPWTSQELPGAGTWRFGLVAVYRDRLDGAGARPCEVVYTTATLGRPPQPVSGFAEVEIYQVVDADADAPERPTGGQYDFLTATLTPPEDWVGPAFPSYTSEQVVYASTATANSAAGNIWIPGDMDWSEPVIVGNADDLNVIYRRFATAPTGGPSASSGIPADAYDNVGDVPAGAGAIYWSLGIRRRGSELYNWSDWNLLRGISAREITIYRALSLTASLPSAPSSASWDHSADSLTGITGWSRTFPTYNPDTQRVACTIATAFSTDTLSSWSTVRICEAAGDLNAVYRRVAAGTTPPRPPSGTATVPTGWIDIADNLTGSGLGWVSVGHRPVGSATWTWSTPNRVEALDGPPGMDGADGISSRELTIYRALSLTASLPSAPSSARWDHSADSLTGITGWSRNFPTYNPDTQRVACTLATGFSTDMLSSWSTVRICEAAGDLNAVYRRVAAGTTPPRPPSGTATVPTGWIDIADNLTGSGLGWVSVGHRPVGSATWTWSTPNRVEALDGPPGMDGADGISSRELTIYRALSLTASLPSAPSSASWDHSADSLTGITGWSRTFPTYNPDTQRVACTIATGFSDDTLSSWSAVRICESAGDLNAVYRRVTAGTTPARPPSGTATVPTGWIDIADNLTGSGLAWVTVGHRPAGSATWTWSTPNRIAALDGAPGADGDPGVSARELTIYRSLTLTATLPSAPSSARWDHSADSLTGITGWSRTFPSYNPETHRVACTIATGFSDDTLSSWSTVRICEAAGDLNAVYRRVAAGTTPSRPPSGTATVPTGWVDLSSSLTGSGLAWVSIGHRPVGSATWTWSQPNRIAALDGAPGADGDPGAGIETIYARTATETLTALQRPLNTWGYKQGGTRGGVVWSSSVPTLTAALPVQWEAQRDIVGTPSVGDQISDTWSIPAVTGRRGADGAAAPRVWTRLRSADLAVAGTVMSATVSSLAFDVIVFYVDKGGDYGTCAIPADDITTTTNPASTASRIAFARGSGTTGIMQLRVGKSGNTLYFVQHTSGRGGTIQNIWGVDN